MEGRKETEIEIILRVKKKSFPKPGYREISFLENDSMFVIIF